MQSSSATVAALATPEAKANNVSSPRLAAEIHPTLASPIDIAIANQSNTLQRARLVAQFAPAPVAPEHPRRTIATVLDQIASP